MTERLKKAVIYSIVLGTETDVLLFLQLLIAPIARSAVNVCAISNRFLLVTLVTNRVSLEEVCMSRFEVLNCLLNLRLAAWKMRTIFH